jgi:DNA helicase-2/ATP-dependent DNA helicase PcrA
LKYLESLNDRQREAVLATEGAVIVLAGAGSGKTKTLITRVAHLIQKGVAPSQILAVTFTNKAAAEMKERVVRLLGEMGGGMDHMRWAQPWMGFSGYMPEVSTFHSFCVKLLRQEAAAIGFTRPFVIYDDDDTMSLLKKICEEFDIDTKNAKGFKNLIDQFKCQAIGPAEMNPQEFLGPVGPQLQKVYTRYQEVLRSSHAFDFGDLIVEAYKLLRDRPEILERYQDRFRYLMVDEYQDTNRAQYLLVGLLAKKYKNICVVGDEDQSIYKWRGADIRNILDFQRDYPNATIVKLEQNYRSTQTIINAATAVIKNNESRYDKTLWTANEVGEKIQWIQVPDERAEADTVAREIQKWMSKHRSHQDVAIFYRSHAQSRAMEAALGKARIPYRIVGGVGFYERREIKDALAYMRVLVNPDDSVSLMRIINVPARGLGKTTLEKVEAFATARRLSFFAGLRKMLEEGASELPPSAKKKLADFVKMLDGFRDLAARSSVGEVYHHILEATGYVAELKAENSDEAKGRIQNLEELDTVILSFEQDAEARGLTPQDGLLQGFLNQVTLEASLLDKAEESATGAISMMTLHSSKGLEFPLVFLVGCEDGIFPSRRAIDENNTDPDAIEEERRLCYVGITRARKKLVITSAQMRMIYGQVQVSEPSCFIKEIPEEFLELEVQQRTDGYGFGSTSSQFRSSREASYRKPAVSYTKGDSRRYDYSDSDAPDAPPTYVVKTAETASGGIRVGQKVRHESYGVGTVKSLEGSESDRKATIEFGGRNVKKFSLKHVQLEFL